MNGSLNDKEILEALEKNSRPVLFIDFANSLSPRNPAPLYERLLVLKSRGFVLYHGQPETVSITREGFDYLRELRNDVYTRSNDRVARRIAFASLAISFAALIASFISLFKP